MYDKILKIFLYFCAFLTCALLIGLIGYIFYRGTGYITWELLFTSPSALKGTIGILPNMINTLYIILVALLIVLPLGIGAAVYLTEYATSKRFVALIEFATETLTGIPSILYGLVGMLFFVQFLNLQTSLLAGALTLVIMILPTIIRTTQESLKTVPQSYREGAVGLGAGKWHVIRTIVLPGSIDAVSYTHLDVYKRQKQKSSRRLRKMRKTGMSNARQASSYSEKDGWIVTASLGCTACVNRNSSSAAPFPGRIQSAGTLSQRDRMLFRRCIPISG